MADKVQLRHAKKLRSAQTEAEQRLWYHLRAHRFQGLKFKRQKPVGPYIVDFICMERGLVVEVDGGQHNSNEDRDQARDRWLKQQGLSVLRVWNHDVKQNLEAVLESIRLAAQRNGPSPLAPLPQAGEGKAALH